METGDADGGWIATATDLVRFFQALDGSGPKRLIKAKTFKLMIDRPSYMKGSSAWYGFGLDVSWNRKAWEHSGTLDGATSSLVRDRHGYVYAMLCNYWPADSDYTSVVAYAIAQVSVWSNIKKFLVPHTCAATNNKAKAISIHIPHQDFLLNSAAMEKQGYTPCWITGYQVKGQTYLCVIWTNQCKYTCQHSMSENEFLQMIQRMDINLIHVDSYLCGDEVKYAAVYSQADSNAPWSVHLLPEQHVHECIKAEGTKGFTPTKISIHCSQGNTVATLLFRREKINGCWVKTDLDSSNYQADFNKHTRYGHMMAYVKPYQGPSNEIHFSTIWTNPGPYQYTSEFDMSKYRFLNDFMFAAEKKFEPLCLCGYEEENAEKFVAVCVKKVPPKSV